MHENTLFVLLKFDLSFFFFLHVIGQWQGFFFFFFWGGGYSWGRCGRCKNPKPLQSVRSEIPILTWLGFFFMWRASVSLSKK